MRMREIAVSTMSRRLGPHVFGSPRDLYLIFYGIHVLWWYSWLFIEEVWSRFMRWSAIAGCEELKIDGC